MLNNKNIPDLPFSVKIAYVLGQLGWSIGSFGVMNLLYYFYDANLVKGVPMFTSYLPAVAVLSLIAGAGRILDAVTDPIIAGLSDRSTHPFGRRRIFMAIGGLPFILFSVLAFFPPIHDVSWINSAWLLVMVLLFYIFMTIYITPYFALMSELGHTSEERLNLSTWIAVAWAGGFLISNGIYAIQGVFERAGLPSERAVQYTLVIFGVISLVLVYLPVIFVNERKYCMQQVSKQGIWEAVKSSFTNRNFRVFVLADLSYFLALTFIQTGISFYIIQLMGKDKESATSFMSALFLISFLLYIPIAKLAKRWGKKNIITLSFILFIAGTLWMSLWGMLPISSTATVVISIGIMVFPVSAFGFLLYAVVGDIAEADAFVTGHHKSGLFFGTRTFMSKMGNAITLLIFPFVSHIGGTNNKVAPLGLRLTLILAAMLLTIGLILFRTYDEKGVNKTLKQRRETLFRQSQ